MQSLRKSNARGHVNFGWLNSYHTFSFGEYYDPKQQGFRNLRVINDDRVQAGAGFPTHSHQDMEIITYVIKGALEHRDSLGNGSVLSEGNVQRMSAGTGISHSEFNHSKTQELHFLQIWVFPKTKDITPGYEEKYFSPEEKQNTWKKIVSPDNSDDSIKIHQDVTLFASRLDQGERLHKKLLPERHAWLQMVRGSIRINEHMLQTGDGLAISNETELLIEGMKSAEILLFDLA